MKKHLIFLLITLLILSANQAHAASEVTLNPGTPVPEDTIAFTITADTTDTINNVFLRVQECAGSLCYGFDNLSTTPSGDTYTVSYTLTHSDATYMTYQVIIETTNGWIEESYVEVDLDLSGGDNNGNGSTTNGNAEDTEDDPFLYFLAAIAAVIVIGSALIVMVLRKKH